MNLKGIWIIVLGLLLETVWGGVGCKLCRWTIGSINEILSSSTFKKIIATVGIKVCSQFTDKEFCEVTIPKYYPMLQTLINLLNGRTICSRVGLCASPRLIRDEDRLYIKKRLASAPPVRPYRPYNRHNDKNFTILVFTDAHVDPLYREGKSGICPRRPCCRVGSPNATKKEDRAGKFGYLGFCDLPMRTLDEFLSKAVEINPDVILWLGDNPGHDAIHEKKETHLDIFRHISNYFVENYSGKVYAVTGNHDSIPDGQFDIHNGFHQWILDGWAESLKHWYSPTGYETMKKFGRFSELVPGSKLRIIGLNNFVMDLTNIYLYENATDPLGQLAWLEKELQAAENNAEKVIIIGHVPTQCLSGERTWSVRLAVLVERYSHIITGQFFGHLHQDYFTLVNSQANPSRAVGVVNVHPSLTTYYGNNPSFRVYELDTDEYRLQDYRQYRLFIKEANKKGVAEWVISHRFREFYNVSSMDPREYQKIVKELRHNTTFFASAYKMRQAEGTKGGFPSDPTVREKILCSYTSGTFYEYEKCTNGSFNGQTEYIQLGIISKRLFPDWWVAVDE